jgi:hypothetical protein
MSQYPMCASCQSPIRWVTMPSGKHMPLDTTPSPDGNVCVHSDGVKAAVLTADELAQFPADLPRFKSHFATCPGAAKHRKPKQ